MSKGSREVNQEIFEQVATPEAENGRREAQPQPPSVARPWYRRPLPLVLAVVVLLAILGGGGFYLQHALTHESTDDAFIEAHVVQVSPKVASRVERVSIDDNWRVKAGDLLVELDPRDFDAQLAQARANLAGAVARHEGATINVRVVNVTSGAAVQQAVSLVAVPVVERHEGIPAMAGPGDRLPEMPYASIAAVQELVVMRDAEGIMEVFAGADIRHEADLLQHVAPERHAVTGDEIDRAAAGERR